MTFLCFCGSWNLLVIVLIAVSASPLPSPTAAVSAASARYAAGHDMNTRHEHLTCNMHTGSLIGTQVAAT